MTWGTAFKLSIAIAFGTFLGWQIDAITTALVWAPMIEAQYGG